MNEEGKKPVSDPAFWRTRINRVLAHGKESHEIVYITDRETWKNIQNVTAGILKKLLKPGMKILDAGCGYGDLYGFLPEGFLTGSGEYQVPGEYLGVDISPELIAIAKEKHPDGVFMVGDLRSLPNIPDKWYSYVVCRSIDGMIKTNLGEDVWREMRKELLRVGRRLLLISYEDPESYMIEKN